jgi:hypothetical protein
MAEFDFGSLPQEVATVLCDALNWRIARDASHDAIAEGHLRDLEQSTIDFKEWCRVRTNHNMSAEEYEMLKGIILDRHAPIPKARDLRRQARQKRIAESHLQMVKGEDDS